MKLRERRGFTLVELIIVIAILGVISAIAAPAVTKIFNQAKVDADKRSAEQVLQAARLTATQLLDSDTSLLPETGTTSVAVGTTFTAKLKDNLQNQELPKPKSGGATGAFTLQYTPSSDKFDIAFTTKAYTGNSLDIKGTYSLVEGDKWKKDGTYS